MDTKTLKVGQIVRFAAPDGETYDAIVKGVNHQDGDVLVQYTMTRVTWTNAKNVSIPR